MQAPAPAKLKAKWMWHGDDGWHDYDPKLSDKLEKAWKDDEDEVKVDDERFVDLKEFLQRRYDDRMKRRGVKRIPPQFMQDQIVFPLLPAKQKKTVGDMVQEYGGLIASALNNKCTLVVLNEKDGNKYSTQLATARKFKIPRVKPDFFDTCEEEEQLVDHSSYLIKTDEDDEEEEEEEEQKTTKDDNIQVDNSKKRKADDDSNATTSTTASATQSPPPANKKARTDVASSSSSNGPSEVVETYLQAKSVWSGLAEQPGFDPCPLMLTVSARNGDEVSGTINWATLSTTTKFRGKISGDTLTFEEYEIVIGDDVELPNNYTASLAADGTLEGTFIDSHSEQGKFKLSNTYHVPPPKDNFRAKSVWRGVAHVPFPFEMEVLSRTGNAFSGVVTWLLMDKAQTKIKGTISSNQLKFEEYEVISGHDEVDVPSHFTCTLASAGQDTSVSGSFSGPATTEEGSFEMKLVATPSSN